MVAELFSYSYPSTLCYVTPTSTNMCTAAVWNEKLIGGLVPRTIKLTGPYFTTCELHSSGEPPESDIMICSYTYM